MTTRNAYDTSYDYFIGDDDEERAYHIWEAMRWLTIAQAEGNKGDVAKAKRWLRELDYDLSASDTDFQFVA